MDNAQITLPYNGYAVENGDEQNALRQDAQGP